MGVALYNDHFGFRERPFSLSPDPDFLFWSAAHKRAYAVLEYGLVTHAPLTVVTGEVGTGKTTLVQALLRGIDQNLTVGLISNAQGDRGDLLRWVLNALDIACDPRADYVTLFQQFQDFVVAEYAAGRHVLLIVDEAQNLGVETLEELRMLTNINAGKDELLQIMLVGQPELRDLISQPRLRQFAQRVTAVYHLGPMDLTTSRNYIRHRLQHVGGKGDEISPRAVSLIHSEAEGIPRVINKLCDLSLVYAASADKPQVDLTIVKELIRDGLNLRSVTPPLLLISPIALPDEAAE
jgi:type II secretory pathway predicted ATPase ExeA